MARLMRVLCIAAVLALIAPAARAQLVADLSEHLIAITTGFVGTDVLLFGAIEGTGDVVVVVRGPARNEVVRRKGRIAGIWINEREVEFSGVPSFYVVASAKPLEQILSPVARTRHEIGFDYLQFAPMRTIAPAEANEFRQALIRNKQREDLYVSEVGKVSFLGSRLFRTRLYFPSNVPTGTYTADVFLVRDGNVISAQSTPLVVGKIGFGAELFDFAHRRPVLYGILAVVVALAAGWLAGVAFKRA
jgi:uncharacterized protein (TIGR02186 family)